MDDRTVDVLPHAAWACSRAGGCRRRFAAAPCLPERGGAGRPRRIRAARCAHVVLVVAMLLLGGVVRADVGAGAALRLRAEEGPGKDAEAMQGEDFAAAAGKLVDGQLQLAHEHSMRGRTIKQTTSSSAGTSSASSAAVPFSSSRKSSGALGQGLVSLLVLYILLFISVSPSRSCFLGCYISHTHTHTPHKHTQCFLGCNIRNGWKLYCPVFLVVRERDGRTEGGREGERFFQDRWTLYCSILCVLNERRG
jgi:hypothetical protein